MKNSKKFLFLGIAATLLFSCGGKTPASSEAPVSSETVTSAPASSEETPSTPVSSEEVAKEVKVSIEMSSFVGTTGWETGTAHLELPTGTDDLTITAAGTAVGSYGLNTGKFYFGTDSNTGEQYSNWRLYQNENPKVTFASTTKTIVSIKITYDSNKTGVLTNSAGNVESGTVVEVNASSYEFGVGNTSADQKKGQVRVSAIEVVLK